MPAYVISIPTLYHDGSTKAEEMRQALVEAGMEHDVRPSEPNSAVVVQDGNCYHCPETVRNQLLVRMSGYRH